MCCLLFWLLGLVLLASLFYSWLSIESSWHFHAQTVFLWILGIRYYYDFLFYISLASWNYLDVFCLHYCLFVVCFCHFAFAFLFSLILSRMSVEIIFVCLLLGSWLVVAHAASCIISVNVLTAWSMCFFFFYLFIKIHNLSNLDIWWNFLTVKLACWWLPPAGYHPRVS